MPLLKKIIEDYQPLYDLKMADVEKTSEFYYYHSKKWSLRIIFRFFQKHAKKNIFRRTGFNNFGNEWFENHGKYFIRPLF